MTNLDLQRCALDLEEALFLSNQDKKILQEFINRSTKRLELARNPCGWLARNVTRRKECNLD